MERKLSKIFLLHFLTTLVTHHVLSITDLPKGMSNNRIIKDPFHTKESLPGKHLPEFVTPTKYIAYALGYYNITLSLESTVEGLLQLDYSTSLTQSTREVLVELVQIIQNLKISKLRSQDQDQDPDLYFDAETESVNRFAALTQAIHEQYEEARTLMEKDFRTVNQELKIWLEFQKKFTENWRNMVKHGITLSERDDDSRDEKMKESEQIEEKEVLSTIQTLTSIYEAYAEIDRLIGKLEGRIASDLESGVFHRNYDNAYINIMKLDQALFRIVQEKNETLSKFKKVSDAARSRMKSLVEEHDLKYVNTLQEIGVLSQKISKAERTFQKYLRNRTFINQRSGEVDQLNDSAEDESLSFKNSNRVEL